MEPQELFPVADLSVDAQKSPIKKRWKQTIGDVNHDGPQIESPDIFMIVSSGYSSFLLQSKNIGPKHLQTESAKASQGSKVTFSQGTQHF